MSRRIRWHWVALASGLMAVALGLLTAAPFRALSADLYTPAEAGVDDRVPAAVRTGAAYGVTSAGAGQVLNPLPKHVALTFDDGPDPTWTPQVQRVLDKHGVKGTFFVIGGQVVRHPVTTRRLAEEGHEVGAHSFTHIDLGKAGPVRTAIEGRATRLVVAGATGEDPGLFRLPFSSTGAAVDNAEMAAIQTLGDDGSLVVWSSVDAKDWGSGTSVESLKRSIEAEPGGHVLRRHDGGGNRAGTVATLDQLIPALQAEGWTVGTVSQTLGLASSSTVPAPSRAMAALGAVSGLWTFSTAAAVLSVIMFAAGILAVGRAIMLLVACRLHRRRGLPSSPSFDPGPVTVVIPAYNEEAGIEPSVRSICASRHPVRVIVVDDGSTDSTAAIVWRLTNELPGVRLISKVNGGKPSALNMGLAATRTDLVVMVDGDTVFEPSTVGNLVRPFTDPTVGAASGNAKVVNRRGLLGRWQHIEYVVGFNMDRRWYDLAGCMPTVPGAVGGFRTDALRRAGGVASDTLAEDTDLTMSLGRAGWRIVYVEDARAWTEAPQTLGSLWKQRYRWSYGTMQSMWKHRSGWSSDNPVERRYMRRCLTYMTLCQVAFPMIAPAVDLFAIWGLLSLNPWLVGGIWLAFMLVDLIVSATAFRADGENLRALWALPLIQFGHRQLLYAVVVHSLATAVCGVRLRRQRMERYGSLTQAATSS